MVDWLEEAESKMRLLGTTNSEQKANFVQSSGGTELSTFWEKEARKRLIPSTDLELAVHRYHSSPSPRARSSSMYLWTDLLNMPQ